MNIEYQVIANILGGSWTDVAPSFKVEYFTEPECRQLAEAIKKVDSQQDEVTPVTVAKQAGWGLEDVMTFCKNSGMRKQTKRNLEFLAEDYRKRTIEQTVKEVYEQIVNSPMSSKEILAKAQQAMIEAMEGTGGLETKGMDSVAERYFEYRLAVENGELPDGISFSMEALTHRTGEIERGNLIILAARPSMGKTALALNEMYHWSKTGHRGLFFSLEQNEIPIARRMMARIAGIDSRRLRGKLTTEEKEKEAAALTEFRNMKLSLVDKRGLNIDQILSMIRLEKHKNPDLEFVALDHLGEISIFGRNVHQELNFVVKKLRDIGGELGVWVLLLSQLSRSVEKRDDKRPVLSDLRDCGGIEEHADIVIMPYRHSYYFPDFGRIPELNSITEIGIKKNREGEMGGGVVARFDMPIMKFYEAPKEYTDMYREALYSEQKGRGTSKG